LSVTQQATEGVCRRPKPGFFEFRAKEKWAAWNKLGNLTKVKRHFHSISPSEMALRRPFDAFS